MTAEPTDTGIPGTSTLTMTSESGRLSSEVRLTGSATIGQKPVEGVRVGYSAGSEQPVLLDPEHSEQVSLTVGTDDLRQLQLDHAGWTVDVTTTAQQTASDAPGWLGSATVTTSHAIEFPRPTHPGGGELELDKVCSGALVGPGTIRWAWPDTDSSSAVTSPAVDQWTVKILGANGWTPIETLDGSARSARVSVDHLLGVGTRAWFRIVADPSSGTSAQPATFEVQLRQALSVVGIPVGVVCGDVRPVE